MNSDLPGGLHPDEHVPDSPGLDGLLHALTARGTAEELAGEQAALTMFRAQVRAPVATPAAAAPGALDAPTRVQPKRLPWSSPPRSSPPRSSPLRSSPPRGGLPRLRVGLVAATALVGGFAAAAYTAVLPAPVQHIAYQALHYIGVPNSGPQHPAGGPSGSPPSTAPGGGHRVSPSGLPHPTPSGSGPHSGRPRNVSPTTTPQPSASASSPSGSPGGPGPAVLSAQAVSSAVPAGTAATINGLLTHGSTADSGIGVRLMEHVVGVPGWVRVGQTQTSAQGAVSFTTPVLRRNAWFRLADASGTRSSVVQITVVPSVSATLRAGPKGIKDYVTVTTTYARAGDVVVLQLLQNGTWVTIKQGVLTAAGKVVITISAAKRQGQELQAVLLATRRHGQATSPPVTVPPAA